jgi:hypothetical protein
VDLDLVVAAEALVAGRTVVLALAEALAVSLAVGPAEVLVVGRAMVLAPVMVALVAAEALQRYTPTTRTRPLLTTAVMVVVRRQPSPHERRLHWHRPWRTKLRLGSLKPTNWQPWRRRWRLHGR